MITINDKALQNKEFDNNKVNGNFENTHNPELDDFLAKIYLKNMDKINKISITINLMTIVSIFSFLLFLIIIAIKVNPSMNFSLFYLLFPALVCVMSLTLLLNMYLKLKDIFDEAEKQWIEEEGCTDIGSILSYFSLNLSSISVLVYLIFLCMKYENIMLSDWNIIAIPLYITLFMSFLYFIFILPAFLQNKLYLEISLIFIYLICSFSFFVLLNSKLDKNIENTFLQVFIPTFIALGVHFFYAVYISYKSLKHEFYGKTTLVAFIILIFISCVLIPLKADKKLNNFENWVPVALVIVGYIILMSEKIITLVFGEKEEEPANININTNININHNAK